MRWGRLNDAPIFIDETAASEFAGTAFACTPLARQNDGLGLIVIDYIQLMSFNASKAAKIAQRKFPKYRVRLNRWRKSCKCR